MALPTSPSVVVVETDNSIYTPNVNSSVVGIVGFADKGPVDTATLVTSQNDLLNKFGRPNSNIPGQGLEGALEILEATNQIYFVRCASGATHASSVVSVGFCPSVIVSGPAAFSISPTIIYSLTANDGSVPVSNKSVSLASSTNATSLTQVLNSYFDPTLLNSQDLFAQTDSNGVNYLVSRYAGANARLSVSTASLSTFGFSSVDASGSYQNGTAGNNITAYGGTASSTGTSSLTVAAYSVYPGAGYNLSSLRDGSVVGLTVEVDNVSIRDKVSVNSEGTQKEQIIVQLSPSSPASIEYLLVNDTSRNQSDLIYTEILLSGTHNATAIPNDFSDKLSVPFRMFNWNSQTVSGTPRFVKLVEGTYNFGNGQSGYSTTEAGSNADVAALIGNSASKTGMYAMDDDGFNISMALVPGITNQSVQNALITLAETSKNFVAIVSPPYGFDEAQDAIDWMNGKGARTAAINSSYAAVYWPWVQVFNSFDGASQWYDPAIFAARQYVYTDNVAEPWFAPAGFRRGRLTKPEDVEIILNQGDKDALYSNNINPVTKEGQDGIAIFGQKTGQRNPTALDRVNVRRLMIFMRKVLLQLGKPFQFEANDNFTWELVEDAVTPFLDELKSRRAITEFNVICNETTNTPLRVDRNELWCSIAIKPTKSAETVVFELNLTNQSATING